MIDALSPISYTFGKRIVYLYNFTTSLSCSIPCIPAHEQVHALPWQRVHALLCRQECAYKPVCACRLEPFQHDDDEWCERCREHEWRRVDCELNILMMKNFMLKWRQFTITNDCYNVCIAIIVPILWVSISLLMFWINFFVVVKFIGKANEPMETQNMKWIIYGLKSVSL